MAELKSKPLPVIKGVGGWYASSATERKESLVSNCTMEGNGFRDLFSLLLYPQTIG